MPVLSVAQMREWESLSWSAGRSQSEVINHAGMAVAKRALKLTQPEDRILIVAGRGHNGDDARCAQPHLVGRKVRLLNIADPAAPAATAELESLLQRKPALVIDGLFGIGLNRPLDEAWRSLLDRINQAAPHVLAVDIPSGLDADTGEPGPSTIRADWTLTLGAPKPGLLLPASHPHTGFLEVAWDIGLIPCPFSSDLQWVLPEDFASFPPPRAIASHKGTQGHTAILAGTPGYHGAAVLAARGALRARPGLVSLFCDPQVYLPAASQLQAAMVHSLAPGSILPSTVTAIVAGPGLAAPSVPETWSRHVNALWSTSPLPVVVDASALDLLEPAPFPAEACRVLTPHPGEAARLLATSVQAVQQDRVGAARRLSERFHHCWVVLKGYQTMMGRASGPISINSSGNPFLAQGGSGDLLAGFLGGLLSQPALARDPAETIRYAVWAHGRAAEFLSQSVGLWTIEDLAQTIGVTTI